VGREPATITATALGWHSPHHGIRHHSRARDQPPGVVAGGGIGHQGVGYPAIECSLLADTAARAIGDRTDLIVVAQSDGEAVAA